MPEIVVYSTVIDIPCSVSRADWRAFGVVVSELGLQGSAVEKDGGCNSVQCRCGKEFCWICLTSHNNHSFGDGEKACNKYDKTKELGLSDERAAVKRYLHYFTRYENHQNSLKEEEKLMQQIDAKVKVLATGKCPRYGEVEARSFLEKAVETLHACRKQLMWTYAFAFNCKGPEGQVNIFEDNQADLEQYYGFDIILTSFPSIASTDAGITVLEIVVYITALDIRADWRTFGFAVSKLGLQDGREAVRPAREGQHDPGRRIPVCRTHTRGVPPAGR